MRAATLRFAFFSILTVLLDAATKPPIPPAKMNVPARPQEI
jgi:hypothetical protein